MSANDETFFRTTLGLFHKEIVIDMTALQEGLSTKDFSSLSNTAHKLAAKVGQLGMSGLSSRFRKMELDARNKDEKVFEDADSIYKKTGELIKHLASEINS